MWGAPWRVGLDIQVASVQAIAVQRRRGGWQLRQWWRHPLPTGTFREAILMQPEALSATLAPWRKQLPKGCELHIALPPTLIMQDILTLPPQMVPAAYSWSVNNSLAKLFPLPADALVSDFYHLSGDPAQPPQLMVTVARRAVLECWLAALSAVALTPTVVDITPCVLRSIANQQQLNPQALLLHLQPESTLVVTPRCTPCTFTTLPTTATLLTAARRWCASVCNIEQPTLLLSGELTSLVNETPDPNWQTWSPFAYFSHLSQPLPEQPAVFALACGLALRHEDQR